MINLGFRHSCARVRGLAVLPPSCTSQHGIAGHVVSHVSQSNLSLDADYTDSTHHGTTSSHSHNAKHMFDSTSNFGSAPVATLLPRCQLLVPAALTLNMFTKSLLFQLSQRVVGTICRISPDIPAGIARIKQFSKYLAVMDTGISNVVAANKFMPDIDTDVVLVAKERGTVLLRPAGIRVLLPFLCCGPG